MDMEGGRTREPEGGRGRDGGRTREREGRRESEGKGGTEGERGKGRDGGRGREMEGPREREVQQSKRSSSARNEQNRAEHRGSEQDKECTISLLLDGLATEVTAARRVASLAATLLFAHTPGISSVLPIETHSSC